MIAIARVFLLLLLLAVAGGAQAQSAAEIVTGTDKVRNPDQPFRSTVTFTEFVGGKERDHNTLVVFSKEDPATGQFRNVIQYLAPPRDTGKRVLLDGHSLWFFDPASKASVRISPQQRLIGQAAVGDVLTVNLAADYSATIMGTETIEDAGHQPRSCWHLDLKAANDRSVYGRIEMWVEQGSFHPIKGKFYSDSGRMLKILYYRNFEQRLGGTRPTQAIIIDAVDSSLATVASFGDYRFQEIPDSWFQRDSLPRLQIE